MLKFDVWSRRATRALFGVALASVLAACGGGGSGNAGTPVVGPGSGASSPSGGASSPTSTPSAADLVVVLSKSTMTNSGTDSITATVTSIDANRAAVGGVPVSFSVNANAVVTPGGSATDSKTGALTATLTQGSDSTVRPVTVTVTSGSVTRAVTFNVVQNSTTTNPQASDLTLTLSAASVDDSGSKTVIATATAVDANRIALAGIPVQLSVADTTAFIVAPSSQTNANGQVLGTVSIGQDQANRTITVTATSGTLVRTAALLVTGAHFSQASATPTVLTPGDVGKVVYTLVDQSGNPIVNVPITVSGTGVPSASGTTDPTGTYTFNYTAPNAPGTSLTLLATAGGTTSTVAVPINASTSSVPAAPTPSSKTLNLSSNVVSVNTDNTHNTVTVSALFRTATDAPVKNVRVLFGVDGDNGTGKIDSGTTTVMSDASGAAMTIYTPGAVSSPTNGVTIKGCWSEGDFPVGFAIGSCAADHLVTAPLTIVSSPVSISIGTDNTVTDGASSLTYIKKYAVLVVDAAGNPKSDVQISPSVDLGGYAKGFWYLTTCGTAPCWTQAKTLLGDKGLRVTCPNEDLNRNAVIDSGEDINANTQLDPRKSDVSVSLTGATKTNANGVAVLQLEYPKSIGSWVKFKITVTAAGVLSPPAYYPLGAPVALPSQPLSALASVDDYLTTYQLLPVSAKEVADPLADPSFKVSPYGSSASCTDTK